MSHQVNLLPLGTTGHHGNIFTHPVNVNVHIRACQAPDRGLGLFASQRLSKGLKILSEEPLLIAESRDDMVDDVNQDFNNLLPAQKALLTRCYAGRYDMVPLMTIEHVRAQQSTAAYRLQMIAQLNSHEGAGIGCILSPALATINHECIPNTYAYYNHETGLVALHALRDIQPYEELTISYLQDNIYLTAELRPASDARRTTMQVLRREVTSYYSLPSPTEEETVAAIAKLRELIGVMEEEGLMGLERPLCIAEQARLQGVLGDEEGQQLTHRRAMIARRLCIGAEHPSCH
ncbi:hypothetical protein PG995_000331 [Apiospora arundinis]